MKFIHLSKLLIYFVFIATFLTACFENEGYSEPVYESKEIYSPVTFGPGTHRKIVVYKHIKGWTQEEPTWKPCQGLKSNYLKLVTKFRQINNENITIFTYAEKTWITSYIKIANLKNTIFKITEWDDDANYKIIDERGLHKVMCH